MALFSRSFHLMILSLGLLSGFAQGAPLKLEDFLKQVEGANPGYRGLIEESSSSQAISEQANLLFKPQFFTQLQYVDDTRDTPSPGIQGTSNIRRSASIGLREQTPWGLGVQLSLDTNRSILFNVDPTLVPRPDLTNSYIVPLLNFSLWQNFLGRSDRANQKVQRAQELANAYGKAFQARSVLVEAETTFWKLAVTRELLKVQAESVKRARAILNFDERKTKKHLEDSSELLLAKSAALGKELELRSMRDEEQSAALAFNAARGVESSEVSDDLSIPDIETLRNLKPPKRDPRSLGVDASEQAYLAQAAGSEMARQKLLPELSLYGSIFNWGLNFSFPLDVGSTSDIREGYARKAAAADLQFQKKIIDEDHQWQELNRKFSDAQARLEIARELEAIQKNKFENVSKRRSRGLTIEDQVFQYELDSLNASLARVQIEGLILGIRAQMKLFGSAE